jgi:hypothetical protein
VRTSDLKARSPTAISIVKLHAEARITLLCQTSNPDTFGDALRVCLVRTDGDLLVRHPGRRIRMRPRQMQLQSAGHLGQVDMAG